MEKEKLTLKELAGYLPYKLRLQYVDTLTLRKRKAFLTSLGINEIETTYKRKINGCIGDLISWTGNNNVSVMKVKPILRPLSDLTKEITHNGETFVPNKRMQWLFDKTFDYENFVLEGKLNYSKMQNLFEWHFDYKELIGRGLAININDLPNE